MARFFKKTQEENTEMVQEEQKEEVEKQEVKSIKYEKIDVTQSLMNRILVDDAIILGEFDRLDKELKEIRGLENTPYFEALDKAESNARLAFNLWQNYQINIRSLEIQMDSFISNLREECTFVLQKEKDEQKRSKTITNDDVKAKMYSLYKTDMERFDRRKMAFQKVEDNLKNLYELWLLRVRTLQVLLTKR